MDKGDCIQFGRFKLEKEKKGAKLEYDSINGGTFHLVKEDMEHVRDWLTEALKPRYTVEEKVQLGEVGQWEVIDNDCPGYRYPVELVTFKERSGFDAHAEARKLCKQLNEGNF